MGISELLNESKKMLGEMIRKNKFAKANQARAEKTKLTAELAKCAGNLNACKMSFRSAIKEQCKNIEAGKANGFDTIPQEQILWDAAIGYMLVEDATYALKSLGSYDSMTRAYDLLDAATKQITGKKGKLSKSRGGQERDAFGNINSEDVKRSKEELLDGFFEELKQTGDIEACLTAVKNPSKVASERRHSYSSDTVDRAEAPTARTASMSSLDDMLSQLPDQADEVDFSGVADQAMVDIKPPKV